MRPAPKRRVSEVMPVPAPVKGIDDTTSIADMGADYAVEMLNLYPEARALRVRGGYREHVTGMTDNGKTLMSYNAPDGTLEMFCCTDDGIFDVTATTATPTNVHVLTNGLCVWTQFSNIAGTWLIGCNGVDAAFIYDGTTWASFVVDATPTLPGEITGGLLPADISFVHQHKGRLWFLEEETMTAWYLPLNSVAGTVTAFPMGGIFTKGGHLNAIFSWTMDAGYSVDDIFVMQTSQGEIAGYGGTDPSSVGTWWLEARYMIGAPLGRRSNVPLNGDMLMLTIYGIIPLSKVVGGQYQMGATDSTASGRISRTLNDIVAARSNIPGWELAACPSEQTIFLSMPEAGGLEAFQLVMNSVTGAWSRYDLPAETFHEHSNTVFFTDLNGRVLVYGTTTVDNVLLNGTGATPIVSGFQQAYNYFGDPGSNKHYKLIRPIFESSSIPSYLLTISGDFAPGGLDLLGTPGTTTASISQWDVGLWDVDLWSPSLTTFQELVGVSDTGYSASLIVKMRTSVASRYVASHWVFERGVSL